MKHSPRLITLCLSLSTFLALFEITAVIVALPRIAQDLRISASDAAWVIDAYSIAFAGALVVAGVLADRYGRRRALLTGTVIFLMASIACGLASTSSMLLAARALQGIGAAFMVTGGSSLVASSFPDKADRSRAFGTIGVVAGIAMALGPTLGGWLTSWFGWPWIFFANIPFCLLLIIAVPQVIAEARDSSPRAIDLVGVVLLTSALYLTAEALLDRHATHAVRLAFMTGGLILALLFIWQQRRSPHPVFEARVFATPQMAGVGVLLVAVQIGFWAVLVYLPLFLSQGLGVRLEVAGTYLLAATLPMLLVPFVGGRVVTRLGWRRFFACAFGIIAIGDILLIVAALSASPSIRIAASIVGMAVIGIGAALANPQLGNTAMALAPPSHTGVTAAASMIMRQAGLVISIAALGAALVTSDSPSAFVAPFAIAAVGALLAALAAWFLLPNQQ
jgi:MFS family permease